MNEYWLCYEHRLVMPVCGTCSKKETQKVSKEFELIKRLGLTIQQNGGFVKYSDGTSTPLDCTVRADELEALLQKCEMTASDKLLVPLKPTDQRVSKSEIEECIKSKDSLSHGAILLKRILKHGVKE